MPGVESVSVMVFTKSVVVRHVCERHGGPSPQELVDALNRARLRAVLKAGKPSQAHSSATSRKNARQNAHEPPALEAASKSAGDFPPDDRVPAAGGKGTELESLVGCAGVGFVSSAHAADSAGENSRTLSRGPILLLLLTTIFRLYPQPRGHARTLARLTGKEPYNRALLSEK